MNLVWKLLKQHISISQFIGFFFANLVGVLIVLLGIQFYQDTQSAYNGKDGVMSDDYIIINKKVSTIGNTIFKQSTSFDEDELKEMAEQPFVDKVGAFTPSAFKVRAGMNMPGGQSISTDMFFESVPDEFVDTDKKDWKFKEGDETIPIILPRDYIDLYNFGFAKSKNLPTISEGLASSVSFDIQLRGNGKQALMKGQIVGFTNRLNTILVPKDFIEWANKEFGNKKVEKSRVILKVSDPTDEKLTRFIQDNDYQTDDSKLNTSKTAYVLKLVLTIVMSVGLVICLLAFYILMLSVYLLIQKNNTKLENLLLIGYTPQEVARPYQLLTMGLNGLVLVISIVVMLIIRSFYLDKLADFFPSFEAPSTTTTILMGLGLFVIISICNNLLISNKVKNIWKHKD